jgi:hypothetical protein
MGRLTFIMRDSILHWTTESSPSPVIQVHYAREHSHLIRSSVILRVDNVSLREATDLELEKLMQTRSSHVRAFIVLTCNQDLTGRVLPDNHSSCFCTDCKHNPKSY